MFLIGDDEILTPHIQFTKIRNADPNLFSIRVKKPGPYRFLHIFTMQYKKLV